MARFPTEEDIQFIQPQVETPKPIDRETEHNLGAGARGLHALGTGMEHLGYELVREEAKKKADEDALAAARAAHELHLGQIDITEQANDLYDKRRKEADADGKIAGRPWMEVLDDDLKGLYRNYGGRNGERLPGVGRAGPSGYKPAGPRTGVQPTEAGTEAPTAPTPGGAAPPSAAPAPGLPGGPQQASNPGEPVPPAPAPVGMFDGILGMFGLKPQPVAPEAAPGPTPGATPSTQPGANNFDGKQGTGGNNVATAGQPGAGGGVVNGKVEIAAAKARAAAAEQNYRHYKDLMRRANADEEARQQNASIEDANTFARAKTEEIAANPTLYAQNRQLIVDDINTRGNIPPIVKSKMIRDAEVAAAKAALIGAKDKAISQEDYERLQRAAYPGEPTPPNTRRNTVVPKTPYDKGQRGPLEPAPGQAPATKGAQAAAAAPPPQEGQELKEQEAKPLPPPSPSNKMQVWPVTDDGKIKAGPPVPLTSGNIAFATDQSKRSNWTPEGYGSKQTGVITIPSARNPGQFNTYRAVSGGAGRGSGAYGTYQIGGAENKPNLGGTSFALNGGEATTDQAPGMQRPSSKGPIGAKDGQFIHRSGSGATQGCIGIEGGDKKYAEFVEDLQALQKANKGAPVSITMAPQGAIRQEQHYPTEQLPETRAGIVATGKEPQTAADYALNGPPKSDTIQAVGGPKIEMPKLEGQVTPPTISQKELDERPALRNDDGTFSTVKSMSIPLDEKDPEGKQVLIPTIVGGKEVSPEEAIAHYDRTKEHLGVYANPIAATAAAEKISKYQEQTHGPAAQQPAQPQAPTDLRPQWIQNREAEARSGAKAQRAGPFQVVHDADPNWLHNYSQTIDQSKANIETSLNKLIEAKEKFAIEQGVLPTPAEQAQVKEAIQRYGNPELMRRWDEVGQMFVEHVKLADQPAVDALEYLRAQEANLRRYGGSETRLKMIQTLQKMTEARQKKEFDNLLGTAKEGFNSYGIPGAKLSNGPMRVLAPPAIIDQDIKARVEHADKVAEKFGASNDEYEAPEAGKHAVLKKQYYTLEERQKIGALMANDAVTAQKIASDIVRAAPERAADMLHELAPWAKDAWLYGNLALSEKTGNKAAAAIGKELAEADMYQRANPKHENAMQIGKTEYHSMVAEMFGSTFANAPLQYRERLRQAADTLTNDRARRGLYGTNAPTADDWKQAAKDIVGAVNDNGWFGGRTYGGFLNYLPESKSIRGGAWGLRETTSPILLPNTIRADVGAVRTLFGAVRGTDLIGVGPAVLEPYGDLGGENRKRQLETVEKQLRDSYPVNVRDQPGVFAFVTNDPSPGAINKREFLQDPNTGRTLILDINKMEPELRRRLRDQGKTGVFINETTNDPKVRPAPAPVEPYKLSPTIAGP